MISEPELDGNWAGASPAELAGPPARPGGREARGRAPWLWALGGALLASAVWAGVLVVQERDAAAGPPLAYRHSEQLCGEVPLKAVGAAMGGLGVGMPSHGEGPALDWSHCFSIGGKEGSPLTYDAQVMVELHKKTDPEAEFGAGPDLNVNLRSASVVPEQVPGLGERAVFSGQEAGPRLQVLDGGAVFTIRIMWWSGQDGKEPDVDETALKAAMVEDMRVLMDRLRRK
ncbi:hypothetical protein EF910_10420 [Streptomyces sp. WAC07149]|uniref:hypothetical protein n=1 Tax=Streptomyces sp. WAC07149 TaxID=2487425 RepID=UPI000F797597|nr:hypothetical protein [Streptomyces sp. WAC07149]RST06136.1 hypothetical protein EF910_10420 [Streptomyces sp. WAC07149]